MRIHLIRWSQIWGWFGATGYNGPYGKALLEWVPSPSWRYARLSQKNIKKDCHLGVYTTLFGGVVPSWLVHSPPDQTVRADLSPDRGHCVVFLDKTLYYDSASLYQGG